MSQVQPALAGSAWLVSCPPDSAGAAHSALRDVLSSLLETQSEGSISPK